MTTLTGPEATPASGGKAKQLIVFLHGVGADGNDLFGLKDPFQEAFPDAHIASPNAPYDCDMAPHGYQWFSLQDRSSDALLTGVKSVEGVLNQFLDNKLAALGLGFDKLAVIGFSQGTMTALHTMLRRGAPCAGVVGYSGAIVSSRSMNGEIKARPPVCLIHGDADMVVPYAAMADAEATFAINDVPHETHTRQGLGHGIDPEGVNIGIEFLKRKLG